MTRIAITLGDPRGIGPELVAAVLHSPPAGVEFVPVGPDEMIERLPGAGVGVGSLSAPDDAGAHPARTSPGPGVVSDPFFSTAPSTRTERMKPASQLDAASAGRLAGRAVEKAAALAMDKEVSAIVTAPVDKHALHLAGYRYPGQTEWLAALAGNVDVAMMLAAGQLRVVLITTHLPLRDVFRVLTTDRVVAVGRTAERGLRQWFGIAQPRLALCALNPHAGEQGLFGQEEDTILRPAATQLGAAGPLAADTVFVRCLQGEFDAVLAPYHDVGMTAVKVAAFGRGVNITLGLPFIRTAPDHGTALDIAGTGTADPASMKQAVTLAVRLAERAGT